MDCQPHTGYFDDEDNPLDDNGEFYLPGRRFCGFRDCVRPEHIEGLSDEEAFKAVLANPPVLRRGNRNGPKHRMLRKYAQVVYAQVLEIGRKPDMGLTVCQVDNCERPKKARNLCMNHWLMFRRHAPEELKPIRQIKISDFPELLPALNSSQRTKVQERQSHICLFKDCSDFQRVRGLCKRHYATLKNLQRRAK